MSILGTKRDLRKFLRLARQDYVSKHLSTLFIPENIYQPALSHRLMKGQVVAGYVAIGSEVSISNILDHVAKSGCQIVLPVIADRFSQIEFCRWQSGDDLETAAFGFQQPKRGESAVSPDIILTPLVGFDRALNRLGQGAGHYDRAFAKWPAALRIGIAWSVQEVDAIPVDPWDLPLDAVLTEREWITHQKDD